MRHPDQARARLAVLWRRHVGEWLGGGGAWPVGIGLAVPGERKAMQGWDAFQTWRDEWKAWAGPGETAWVERQWPSLGRQEVPEKWWLRDAFDAAAALGEALRWQVADQRFRDITGRWPALEPYLRARYTWLAEADAREWNRVCDMLDWLLTHPASNLFVRQLPVAGLDSKWLEAHVSVLTDWLRLVGARPCAGGFWQTSGLRRESDRLRVRVLDPALRARIGGLCDLHAPFEELARLDWRVRRVFIVENKQTGLAFDDLPGTVVVMARGYAVERLPELPWLAAADHLHYWGDIDTHGLAILGRVRGHLPRVQSLLMDEATLLAHRDLWVTELQPHAAASIDHLDAAEQALYRDLRSDRFGVRVRLEQERIGWPYAWLQILAAP